MLVFAAADGTEWNCDYDRCLFTLRAAAQAKARLQTATIETTDQNIQQIQHNDREFRSLRGQLYRQLCTEFHNLLVEHPHAACTMLAGKHRQIAQDQEDFESRFRGVASHNQGRLRRNLERTTMAIGAMGTGAAVAGIVFMALAPYTIPAAAQTAIGTTGMTVASEMRMTAGAAHAVYTGTVSWAQSGDLGTGIAAGAAQFTANLMGLPVTQEMMQAGGNAAAAYTLVSQANSTSRSAGIAYASLGPNDTRNFLDCFGDEVVRGLGNQAVDAIFPELERELGRALLPIELNASDALTQNVGLGEHHRDMDQELRDIAAQVSHLPSGARSEMARQIFERRQAKLDREREAALWAQTPIYRYFATGDSRSLLTDADRWVHDNLLSLA